MILQTGGALKDYCVWINAYMFDGWSDEEPQWKGKALSANYAAQSAVDWWIRNHGINSRHLSEPITARVYEPFTKAPARYYHVQTSVTLMAHAMVDAGETT